MHLEAHFGLGWTIGVLAPHRNRELRNWCVLASVVPDIDAVTYLFGWEAYSYWHHTFGHNLLLGGLVTGVAVWHQQKRSGHGGLAGMLVALCFGLHLLADAYFTRFPVFLFWPFNREEFLISGGVWLGAPINHWLLYGSFVLAGLLAIWKKITPINVFSPRLDQILVNAFRNRDLHCATCGHGCNNRCHVCEAPTCLRHGRIHWKFMISCPKCGSSFSQGKIEIKR
jgi:hypothetical protein